MYAPWRWENITGCCLRYVEVDEENGTELFYYFVESEAGAEKAPFLLWLTGGDRLHTYSAHGFLRLQRQYRRAPHRISVNGQAKNQI